MLRIAGELPMPCHLFTYHGYGTWLPDHKRGYVHRKEGVLAADPHMADCYRRNLNDEVIHFDKNTQQLLIDATLDTSRFLNVNFHCIACEASHLHLLLSWQKERVWQTINKSLKSRLTLQLNQDLGKRTWFSKGSSHKCVKDRSHFEYLVNSYLPNHRGLFWRESAALHSGDP